MYPPIPGSPDVIEGLAAALRDEAARVESARSRLSSIRDGSRWDSPAGHAFAARVHELPPVLGAVAERYAAAAAVLRTFAAGFREAQEACNQAITLRERGMIRRDRFGDAAAAAEASASPVEQARAQQLRELMAEGIREVMEHEAAYQRAWDRFEDADRRCARALGALLDDALTDSWRYTSLKGTSDVGHSIADTAGLLGLIPPLRGAAAKVGTAATVVGLTADAAVKIAYGEGEWRPILEQAALGAAGFSAGHLRRAARVGAPPSSAHAGPSEFLTARQRLLRGARTYAKGPNTWEQPLPASAASTTAGSHTLRDRAERAVARRVAVVVDDWRLASRNGADARAMLLTAYGLTSGRTIYEKAPKVNDAFERGHRVYERLRGTAPEQGPSTVPTLRDASRSAGPPPAGARAPGDPTR